MFRTTLHPLAFFTAALTAAPRPRPRRDGRRDEPSRDAFDVTARR